MRLMSICHDKKKPHLGQKQIAFLTTPCNTPSCSHTHMHIGQLHTYTRPYAHMWEQSYRFSHTCYLSMPVSIIIPGISVWAYTLDVYGLHRFPDSLESPIRPITSEGSTRQEGYKEGRTMDGVRVQAADKTKEEVLSVRSETSAY